MSPWLRWHHFDPPWREEQHHRPEGIVGLCADHTDAADGDAYSVEELQAWKARGRGDKDVLGQFAWMRSGLAVVMGRCIYDGAIIALEIHGQPAIWLEPSADGPLVLNVRMPTVGDEPRLGVYNNWFVARETPPGMILRCPPIGHRRIEVEYASGDRLAIEFLRVRTKEDWDRLFGPDEDDGDGNGWVDVDLAAVKIELQVPAADIDIDSERIRVGGIEESVGYIRSRVGVALGAGPGGAGARIMDVRPDLTVAPLPFV